MDYNIRTFMICVCFIIGANITTYVFFGDSITQAFTPTGGGGVEALTFLWNFVGMIFGMLFWVLPSQAGTPVIFSVIILVPYYASLLYVIAPIVAKIGELIIQGIDAIIPF